MSEFDSKTDLDFRNRLIAKFAIPRGNAFWGRGFSVIPETSLFPKGDEVLALCTELRDRVRLEVRPGDLGTFVSEWARLEDHVLEDARRFTDRNLSVREAIMTLAREKVFDSDVTTQLDVLRAFRNTVVHRPDTVKPDSLPQWIERIRTVSAKLLRE